MSVTAEPTPLSRKSGEFSLVSGGLFNAFLVRLHLLKAPVELLPQRILVASALAWLPLLFLALLDGNAWGSKVGLPFLYDVATHARCLVAIPLVLLADLHAHTRMPPMVQEFTKRGIVTEADVPEFERILALGPKLTGSVYPEIILLVVAYTAGHLVWAHVFNVSSTSWYFSSPDSLIPTKAGVWYEWVSLPFFRFLFFRWFFRLGVWAYILFKISRLRLQLIPTHPDKEGGLGFLNQVTNVFLPLLAAWGVLLSAQIATKMISQGLHLQDFKFEGAGVLIIALLFILAPLLFFTPDLLEARRRGLREFGTLGARYTREFEGKWIQGKAGDEPLVGSADIQSLADLANSYEVVRKMSPVIISRGAIIQVVFALLLPVLPLVLTVIPLGELVRGLIKVAL
jgi:hypothetical protein